MAGIGKNYEKGGKFTLKSGNKPSFFEMGSSPLHDGKKKTKKKDTRSWLSKADQSVYDLGQKYNKSKVGKFMGKLDRLVTTGKWK